MTTLEMRPRAPVFKPLDLYSSIGCRSDVAVAMLPPPGSGPTRAGSGMRVRRGGRTQCDDSGTKAQLRRHPSATVLARIIPRGNDFSCNSYVSPLVPWVQPVLEPRGPRG